MGFHEAPWDLKPRDIYGWTSRFDDPHSAYRTLYCSEERKTCLREVLSNKFLPDVKTQAEFKALYGERFILAGKVPMGWRREHVLVSSTLDLRGGELIPLEHQSTMTFLRSEYPELLLEHGVDRLDTSSLRGPNRPFTRALSRLFFDRGAAGLIFGSRFDSGCSVALFEGRAALVPDPDQEYQPLKEDFEDLVEVCFELNLLLPRLP